MAIPTQVQYHAWADQTADEAIADTAMTLGKPASEVYAHLSADGLKLLIVKAISMNRVLEMRFMVAEKEKHLAKFRNLPFDSPGC